MYLHLERKLIYISNPKTASVATRDALLKHAGFVQYNERLAHKWQLIGLKLNDRGGAHHVRLDAPAPGWSVATTTRNHWKTMLSWWTAHEHFQEPFNFEWIDKWIRSHERQYFPDPNRLFRFGDEFADVTFRLGSLQDDLDAWLGCPCPLEYNNVSSKKITVDEAYDEETRQYVAWRFADEIEEYGYEWPGS